MEIPSGAYTIKKKMAITKTGALKDFSQSPCLDASHIPIPISATDSNCTQMVHTITRTFQDHYLCSR
jgi:hypothetical protein